MRIIAGTWRSRQLHRPTGDATRPMPDRMRESVFSMLGAHFGTPGALPPLRVGDLFAGSGSIGLEALSRGAASCCFFERNDLALVALRRNLESLEAGDRAKIITGNAWQRGLSAAVGGGFDILFLDPPYRDTLDTSPDGCVYGFLDRLGSSDDAPGLVVFHHPASVVVSPQTGGCWQPGTHRTYGTGAISILKKRLEQE